MSQTNQALIMDNERDYIYQFSQSGTHPEHTTLLNHDIARIIADYQGKMESPYLCFALGPGLEDYIENPTISDFAKKPSKIGVYIHKEALKNTKQVGGYANKETAPNLYDVVEFLR